MATLRDVPFRTSYRTGRDNLVQDFYVPALQKAELYQRATGYFTSSGLAVAAQGIADLVHRRGKMQLVASPCLNEEDIEALKVAAEHPERVLTEIVARSLAQVRHALEYDRLNALAWLAASGSLEVKLALRIDAAGRYSKSIYHEKMGILTDVDQNHVAFFGSSNETAGGLVENFESIKVFRSWQDPEERVAEELENFNALWSNSTVGLKIVDFSQATEDLLRPYKKSRPTSEKRSTGRVAHRTMPPLWPHQIAALDAFLSKKAGVIEMATGTGKTKLALAICSRLVDEGAVRSIIVCTDGNDLLDQWYQALLELTGAFDEQWSVYRHYEKYKEAGDFRLSPQRSVMLVSRDFLHLAIQRLRHNDMERAILIHDEAHGFGSPSNRSRLAGATKHFQYRLGLSATPEREYDVDGNEFIEKEVGPIIFQFSLEGAIEQRILAPFAYHPIDYHPNEEDAARIKKVYSQQAARKLEGKPMSKEEFWTELAKVYKTSRAKLEPFRAFVRDHPNVLKRCIVFVETKAYGEEVLEIIHEFHHEFHTYFGGEDAETLRRFARGDIECLLTCHRLSEGIDIQTLSSVILFSSARTRLETTQRIGRCLRKDPNDPSKLATVVDFIRKDRDDTSDDDRAKWLASLSNIRPI